MQDNNDIKTARQGGWSLSYSRGLVTAYNDFGDFMEVWANVDGVLRYSTKSDVDLGDLPRSVITLICLWLDVQFPKF